MAPASNREERNTNSLAVVRVDDRGRITIPKKIREALDIQEGDTCFINFEDHSFHIVRGENPFEVLARDALEQDKQGKTVSFKEAMESFVSGTDQTEEAPYRAVKEPSERYRAEAISDDIRQHLRQILVEEAERLAEQFAESIERGHLPTPKK